MNVLHALCCSRVLEGATYSALLEATQHVQRVSAKGLAAGVAATVSQRVAGAPQQHLPIGLQLGQETRLQGLQAAVTTHQVVRTPVLSR